jgi:hypothetical protein
MIEPVSFGVDFSLGADEGQGYLPEGSALVESLVDLCLSEMRHFINV